MPSVSQAVLLSWSAPPAARLALGLTALVYLRGWFLLRRAGVPFVPVWRAGCFLLGLLTLWAALASPLDTFSAFIITAHMLQHMLLMMVAPPLILLGAPLIPLVRGLPVFAAREFAGPFMNWRVAIRVGNTLTNLYVALIVMGMVMFAWHTPRLYELALASSSWHEVEHACFFVASLIFWWPVVQPWPSRAQAPRWALLPYLMIGDLQNTVLSAILVFSDRVLYPSYAKMPRLFGFSALHDQAASGAIMWVVGSTAFLVPAVVIAVQCLSGQKISALQAIHGRDSSRDFLRLRPFLSAPRWLRAKFSTPTAEAVTFILLFVATGLCLAALASNSSDDDQVLRERVTSGPFQVSILAPPEIGTGANTFAVLVQDRNTGEVLPDAAVDLGAQQKKGSRESRAIRAGVEDSENKLLQAAVVEFAADGDWLLAVNIKHGADVTNFSLPLQVMKPDSGFRLPWSYRVLLLVAALLLLTYFLRHRAFRAVRLSESVPPMAAANRADNFELVRKTR